MRLKKISIHKILFLDIETVPQYEHWRDVPPAMQELWEKKTATQRKEVSAKDFYKDRAGIWAEFGKIICISCGIVTKKESIRLKSFAGHDERILLEDFAQLLETHFSGATYMLCAHNGKEFDFPYLGRRLLINGLPLPRALDLQGLRPWQIQHLDTLELWRFGDYKNYTSVDLLTNILGIPTPKNDISGGDVARVYYKDKDLERIRLYCEKDVVAVAQIFRKMRGEGLLQVDDSDLEKEENR